MPLVGHAEKLSLFEAIALVETGNDNTKVGAAGELGKYQLTKLYVDDINRILGAKKYSYKDRLNPVKCRKMMRVYWAHYLLVANSQNMARTHNKGPRGWENPQSIKYWNKVKKHLQSRQNVVK